MIYMIAPSISSPVDQLALVGDRTECLAELSNPVTTSDGTIEINDCLSFFGGDKPAQQFERGMQIGGTYKCGGCGQELVPVDVRVTAMNNEGYVQDPSLEYLLQGAQCVPTLLTLNPTQSLDSIN